MMYTKRTIKFNHNITDAEFNQLEKNGDIKGTDIRGVIMYEILRPIIKKTSKKATPRRRR